MKKAEAEYMGRVARLGCMLCKELGYSSFDDEGTYPVELHHVREGQGMSQRASNFLVIPLCPSCHRGPHGIHGDRLKLRNACVDEIALLAMTIEALN
jgi:hypothetical protein